MPTVAESIQRVGNELALRLIFGGGENSAANVGRIDVRECTIGENFDLRLDSDTFRQRAPFDLAGTATNNAEVRGIIEFQKSDGTNYVLIQAGGIVYSWDGASGFTQVGTCHASSRLRGGRYSTSVVDDFVIITDLEKLTVVKTFDGTTFTNLNHNLSTADFFAKYCRVIDERALFFNVKSGTDTPHVILGSGRGTTTSTTAVATLTVTNRPASGLGANDPFFIPMPDLKAINGVVDAFGLVAISTVDGQMWQLKGNSPTISTTTDEYRIDGLFKDSGATGDEAVISIGNDIIYGRAGRIDSLVGTLAFGDVEVDDVSRQISNSDSIRNTDEWAAAIYNPRLKRAYFWPKDGNEVWAFSQPIYEPLKKNPVLAQDIISPWSRWTTTEGNGDFRQSSVGLAKRPTDGKELVYFGSTGGKFYQLEGEGAQDGGSATVTAKRTSGLIELPIGDAFDVTGYVTYRKISATTLTLTFKFGGDELVDETATLTLPAPTGGRYFGGDAYFGGGDDYFGVPFEKRLERQPFDAPGQGNLLQIEAQISSTTGSSEIHEILVKIKPAASPAT